MDDLARQSIKLPDGRIVTLFVNKTTRLIVVDVVDADEKGGRELLRYTAREGVKA